MQFADAVVQIIQDADRPLAPSEIREQLKIKYPGFYDTEAHRQYVQKGSHQSLDHALLAQVYGLARNSRFICDRSSKPMKLSVADTEESPAEESIDFLSAEEVEKNVGTIYVLKTGTFTQSGKEIFKIGITSGVIEQRISQLFTTGVPYRFQIHATYRVSGFIDLERSLHSLLARFRLNASREFFTEGAIPFIERIITLHNEIQKAE